MTYTNSLFKDLAAVDEKIQKEFNSKIVIINTFLEEIKDICNIFYDVWENEENKITNELKSIAKKHSFTLQMSGTGMLTYHNIIKNLVCSFPIHNSDQEAIIGSLPRTNQDWKFTDSSTEETINIEVIPIDNYSRYPTYSDDNTMMFNYFIDKKLHNKLIQSSFEEKGSLIKEYFEKITKEYLIEIEIEIIKKAHKMNDALKGIDFNNPEIVAELKNRLNRIK